MVIVVTVSIIIALYNAEKTLESTLKSVIRSKFKNYEIIVVDDCSTDKSLDIVKKYPCKIIKLKKKSGPAIARNIGASVARGKYLFFIDSDITFGKNAIKELVKTFKTTDADAVCCGNWMDALNPGAVPSYWAMTKFYDWNSEKDWITVFTTNRGAVKRSVFKKLCGFKTSYNQADVEDLEFGYRLIEKNYKIFLNKKIHIKHHFPGFFFSIRKMFKRSSSWAKLFMKRKRFDTVCTTPLRGISSALATLMVFFGFLSIFMQPIQILFTILFFILLIINSKLYIFVLMKKGIFYTMKFVIISFIFYFMMGIGVAFSMARGLICT